MSMSYIIKMSKWVLLWLLALPASFSQVWRQVRKERGSYSPVCSCWRISAPTVAWLCLGVLLYLPIARDLLTSPGNDAGKLSRTLMFLWLAQHVNTFSYYCAHTALSDPMTTKAFLMLLLSTVFTVYLNIQRSILIKTPGCRTPGNDLAAKWLIVFADLYPVRGSWLY